MLKLLFFIFKQDRFSYNTFKRYKITNNNGKLANIILMKTNIGHNNPPLDPKETIQNNIEKNLF